MRSYLVRCVYTGVTVGTDLAILAGLLGTVVPVEGTVVPVEGTGAL